MKANLLFFLLKCSLCPIYKNLLTTPRLQRLSYIFSPRSGIGFTFLGFPISLIVHFKLLFFIYIRFKSHFFPYWYPVLVPPVEKSFFPPLNCLAPLSKIAWLYIYVCVCVFVCVYIYRENLFLFHYLYVYPSVSNKFSWLLWLFNSLKIRCVCALKLCFSCPNIVFWLL